MPISPEARPVCFFDPNLHEKGRVCYVAPLPDKVAIDMENFAKNRQIEIRDSIGNPLYLEPPPLVDLASNYNGIDQCSGPIICEKKQDTFVVRLPKSEGFFDPFETVRQLWFLADLTQNPEGREQEIKQAVRRWAGKDGVFEGGESIIFKKLGVNECGEDIYTVGVIDMDPRFDSKRARGMTINEIINFLNQYSVGFDKTQYLAASEVVNQVEAEIVSTPQKNMVKAQDAGFEINDTFCDGRKVTANSYFQSCLLEGGAEGVLSVRLQKGVDINWEAFFTMVLESKNTVFMPNTKQKIGADALADYFGGKKVQISYKDDYFELTDPRLSRNVFVGDGGIKIWIPDGMAYLNESVYVKNQNRFFAEVNRRIKKQKNMARISENWKWAVEHPIAVGLGAGAVAGALWLLFSGFSLAFESDPSDGESKNKKKVSPEPSFSGNGNGNKDKNPKSSPPPPPPSDKMAYDPNRGGWTETSSEKLRSNPQKRQGGGSHRQPTILDGFLPFLNARILGEEQERVARAKNGLGEGGNEIVDGDWKEVE